MFYDFLVYGLEECNLQQVWITYHMAWATHYFFQSVWSRYSVTSFGSFHMIASPLLYGATYD